MRKIKKVPVILQMEAVECGAASLTMILAYYKKYIPSSRLQFYSLIPPFELKTELSRSVLPKMYNRCDEY